MSTLLVTLMLSGAPAGESTWLGLLAASGKDEQGPCARVVAVAPSGPAATKLTTADCIHSVDGVPVLDSDSFAAAVKGKARDQVVALGLAHRLVEVRSPAGGTARECV